MRDHAALLQAEGAHVLGLDSLTSRGERAQVRTYAGAYHGFDGDAALRLRRDGSGGVNPGQGVHVGGDAAARADSRERLPAFMREQLRPADTGLVR